jgi:hypothetical protein
VPMIAYLFVNMSSFTANGGNAQCVALLFRWVVILRQLQAPGRSADL